MNQREKKMTVHASVKSIKETTAANPTMACSRSGMALASMVSVYQGIFSLDNGEEITLNVPEKMAEDLIPGMRGSLCYRGGRGISFDAEKN